MKFRVNYQANWNRSIGGSNLDLSFYGEGAVFLHETALICEGRMPKFELWILDFVYQKVITIPTARTIPYATVLKYKKPSGLRRTNLITYRLPNGKKCNVSFVVKIDDNNNADAIFSARLQEYLVAANSLT